MLDCLPTMKAFGRHILDTLFHFESQFIRIHSESDYTNDNNSTGGLSSNNSTNLLYFNEISFEQRNLILKEILNCHLEYPLTNDEISKLKSLNLFTKSTGEAFASNQL